MFALGAHTFYFVRRTVTDQRQNCFLGKSCHFIVKSEIDLYEYFFSFLSSYLAFVHSIQLAKYEIAVMVFTFLDCN